MIEPRLQPPATKDHVSVAHLPNFWYIACASRELGAKPRSITILGTPLVLFRTRSGVPGVLLDRCPHRNVPLSMGAVVGERIQCGYHGWEFDTEGACQLVPGLCSEPDAKGRRAERYPVREQDGFVWVFLTPDVEPDTEPFRFPKMDDEAYTTAYRSVEAQASVHATIENALDVPHTAYLHKGLFRGTGEPNEIDVVVRRWHDRVEAEYIGEPRPEGVVGRLLSPSGGVVTHFDRFFMPSIAQVEYRIGDENHILVTSACTPVSDFHTVLHAVISFRMRIPGALIKPVLQPLALKIFSQDAVVLKLQTEAIHRFGGEQYVSTELDILGPQIWRLMRQAERGEVTPATEPTTKSLKMRV